MKIILVFGLSGVGKSTLITRAAETHQFLHLSASDLIKAGLRRYATQATSEELRTGAVLDNQQILLEEFHAATAATSHQVVLFDGHNLIETPSGLLEIPASVLSALKGDEIIFVEDDPVAIASRRSADASRTRPLRNADELRDQQNLAKSKAQLLADHISVPFRVIRSGDTDGIIGSMSA